MLSARYAALALAVMFIALAFSASAQWSPGGVMVYMGDLNLAASSVSSGNAVQALGGSQAATNSSPINNSSLNSSINATTIDNSTVASTSAALPSAAPAESSGKEILDLSSYSRDRANRNLAGYKNIMYPISGSRGTTTSTSGGGGSCGGCG
ncbi:MAG: hypothetical protein PHW87_05650 [Methanothrix sp.]|nr:hypothetical protein [Methanothrix sp.]